MTSFSFFVDSDLQINDPLQIDNKEGHLKKMLELIDRVLVETPVKAFLSPGDLTDHGLYYSPPLVFLNQILKKIPRLKPIFSDDSDNELQVVLNTYVHPLRRAGVKSYLCAGNHDTSGPFWKPVLSYLRRRHGNLCYSFNINGLHFACCGVVPNKQIRNWLAHDLAKLAPNTPVVLMWHYPISGPYSGKPYPGGEWWARTKDDSDAEKVLTYGLIKDYNIIGIFTGHFHISYRSDWHDIPIFNTGGGSFCHAIYKPQNPGPRTSLSSGREQNLETKYYDKNGITEVPYERYTRSMGYEGERI